MSIFSEQRSKVQHLLSQSLCLSVRLSVPLVCRAKTVQDGIKIQSTPL